MHESGCRVSETVDAIENAAMAGDEAARVLDAEIALHRRERNVAEESRDPEDRACKRRPAPIHRREIGSGGGGERRCRRDAADQALPGLLRAHRGRDLVAAEQLAPAILRHVVELGEDRKSTRLNSSHLGISYA